MQVLNTQVTWRDVESHLAASNPEMFEVYIRAVEARERQAELEAMALQAQLDAERANIANLQGPQLAAECGNRLQLVAPVNAVSTMEYVLNNVGTTAVYYTWQHEDEQLPPPAKGGVAVQRFYMPDTKGVILPNDQKRFRFSFKSEQASAECPVCASSCNQNGRRWWRCLCFEPAP